MKHIFLFTGESKTGKTILARITNADETTTVIHDFALEDKIGISENMYKVLRTAANYNDKCSNIIIVVTEITAKIFKMLYNEDKYLQENYMLSILNFERVGDVKWEYYFLIVVFMLHIGIIM